jgi:branched-chain amino acid aminotransferase
MTAFLFQDGFAPVKVLAETTYKRAFKGGTGDSKVGGNYAPGLLPQQLSSKKGYSQVLWLGEDDAVTEVGAMNLFVFWTTPQGKKQLITAPLDGTICSEILPNPQIQILFNPI